MRIIRFLKDIIAPKKCYFCKSEGHFLCLSCYKNSPRILPLCYVCKKKSNGFLIHSHCRQYLDTQSLIVLFSYKHIQKLVKDAKYYTKKDILEDLGLYAGKNLLEILKIEDRKDYLLLPIPMNFWRKSKRGYNHTDVLVRHISNETGILYKTKAIKRVKNTLQQSKLTRHERLSNLDGAFKIDEKYKETLKGKRIILVDDVVSTGVTFLEVSSVLHAAGVESIDCIALASDVEIFDEKT